MIFEQEGSATSAKNRTRLVAERPEDDVTLRGVVHGERCRALEGNEALSELRLKNPAAEFDEAAVDLSLVVERILDDGLQSTIGLWGAAVGGEVNLAGPGEAYRQRLPRQGRSGRPFILARD